MNCHKKNLSCNVNFLKNELTINLYTSSKNIIQCSFVDLCTALEATTLKEPVQPASGTVTEWQ